MKPEQEYRQRIDESLLNYFEIEREVYSTFGKRLDYVLKCKHSKALFGLEVKSDLHKRGNNYVSFLKQANEYTNELWKTIFYPEATKLPIFIAPAVSKDIKQIVLTSRISYKGDSYYKLFHSSEVKHCNVHGLISGLLDVGEIKKYRGDKFCFMYHNWDVWTSYKTPEHRFKQKHYESYFKFIELNKVI
jgi:hypothetical protein